MEIRFQVPDSDPQIDVKPPHKIFSVLVDNLMQDFGLDKTEVIQQANRRAAAGSASRSEDPTNSLLSTIETARGSQQLAQILPDRLAQPLKDFSSGKSFLFAVNTRGLIADCRI